MTNYNLLNEESVIRHKNLGDIDIKIDNGESLLYKEVGNYIVTYDINDLNIDIINLVDDVGKFLGIPSYYVRDDVIGIDEYILNVEDIKDIEILLYYNNLKNISLHMNHLKTNDNEFHSEYIIITNLENSSVHLMDIEMNEIECSHALNIILDKDYKMPDLLLKFIDIKNVHIMLFDEGSKGILFECLK